MADKRGSGDANDASDNNNNKKGRLDTVILVSPKTSESDNKLFKCIQLPNGLRALLISDPGLENAESWTNLSLDGNLYMRREASLESLDDLSKHSSQYLSLLKHKCEKNLKFSRETAITARAAMCLVIATGSADDPTGCPGLAHFTEHMIHYGSKKYSDIGQYWNFIQNHGSFINAYTQMHSTVYQVAINPDFLEEAMKLFAYSISDPSFDQKVTADEVESVDNEFKLRQWGDMWKMMDVLRYVANIKHPASNFSCGNKDTLNAGGNLHQELVKFHGQNYVAKKMILAVQSTSSLDELQELVEKYFLDVKSGEGPQQVPPGEPYSDERFFKFYRMEGNRRLYMVWRFHSGIWNDMKSKPLRLLEILLNDAGPGSLNTVFMKRGWIISMDSRSPKADVCQNQYCTLFATSIVLTKLGENNITKIIQDIFGYIDMLRKTPLNLYEGLWEELRCCSKREFQYSGSGSALENTQFAATKMLTNRSGIANIFTDEILFEGSYNHEPLKGLLDSIWPDKTLYLHLSPEELQVNDKMPHSNFRFIKQDIRKEFLTPVKEQWTFPERNSFICKLFQIHMNEEQKNISYNGKLIIVQMPNVGLLMPKCRYQIIFGSSECDNNPLQSQLMSMLVFYLNVRMHKDLVSAARAGISADIDRSALVISLNMTGFHDKIPQLLRKFCEIFNEITTENFNTLKEYEEFRFRKSLQCPMALSAHLYQDLFIVDRQSALQTENNLGAVTEKDFLYFVSVFKSSMFIQCVMEGNIYPVDAGEVKAILENIKYSQMKDLSVLQTPPTQLLVPPGEKTVRVRISRDGRNCNNVVTNIYQIANENNDSLNLITCWIVTSLMSGPTFQTLRTQQQLGYSVDVTQPSSFPISFTVSVVCPNTKHTVCSINEKIDSFLKIFYDDFLMKMNNDQFRDFKVKLQNTKHYLSIEDIRMWYMENIYRPVVNRSFTNLRKISIHVMGSDFEKGSKICKCPLCSRVVFKPSGNGPVEFASDKNPSSEANKKHELIHDICKFHENANR